MSNPFIKTTPRENTVHQTVLCRMILYFQLDYKFHEVSDVAEITLG